jgi:phosphoribosyl-ATP pyrophosphohydrolase/phosphoribosyl-AMP cyclohydrolase
MNIDFNKGNGLVPAIIQDADTGTVLMLGYMNAEALEKTRETGLVTFYSRSKKRLWTKGETSGNFLKMIEITADCDNDTLLVKVKPSGPACHTGQDTCFGEAPAKGFIYKLEEVIKGRKSQPAEGSYTSLLFNQGMEKIAQKVGEEATEVIIEAMGSNDEALTNEAADLLYHLVVLLQARNLSFTDVERVLQGRDKPRG